MLKTIKNFIKMEAFGGLFLFIFTVLAIIVANNGGFDVYRNILNYKLDFYFIKKSVLHFINDGLMSLFFLLVSLEIKREFIQGELSSKDKAILPVAAALGGAIFPAILYSIVNIDAPENMRGWAIPMATDIAFALGVMSLFPQKLISNSSRVLLLAIAIIDDILAILVITIFYSKNISLVHISLAGLVVLFLLGVKFTKLFHTYTYIILGSILWYLFLKSGVHATIAGVLLGFTIPLKKDHDKNTTMLNKFEKNLHPWVTYFILPIFAFANAGIDLRNISFDVINQKIVKGITLGLCCGAPLGIMVVSFAMVKFRFCKLPSGVTWAQYLAVACYTGIGFTMSLFIGNLAFNNENISQQVKLGVIIGSLTSILLGTCLLYVANFLEKKQSK